jgi:hypothetical protein
VSTTPPLTNAQLTALEQRILAVENALAATRAAIHYDDATKTITLLTPAGQTIAIADGSKAITLKDASGNSIVMSSTGIVITSTSDISLKAVGNITQTATQGNITLTAAQGNIAQVATQGNVSVTAAGNATTNAAQVNMEAQTTFSAKATATAEVTASGVLTLRGSLVSIN